METMNLTEFDAGSFSDVSSTQLATDLWVFVNNEMSITAMETASYLKRPAVEGLEWLLIKNFPIDEVRQRRIKQMLGKMVKQVMQARSYEIEKVAKTLRGKLFKTGTRYVIVKQEQEQ